MFFLLIVARFKTYFSERENRLALFLCGVGQTPSLASIRCRYLFFILVLQEYLVLTDSRIPLKSVLVGGGGVRIVVLSISSH